MINPLFVMIGILAFIIWFWIAKGFGESGGM